MFVSFQEKVILTQNFRRKNAVKYKTFRQTLQQNKISFEFSLRKKNLIGIKIIPYTKGFPQRWECINNATNIKHKTYDIKKITKR